MRFWTFQSLPVFLPGWVLLPRGVRWARGQQPPHSSLLRPQSLTLTGKECGRWARNPDVRPSPRPTSACSAPGFLLSLQLGGGCPTRGPVKALWGEERGVGDWGSLTKCFAESGWGAGAAPTQEVSQNPGERGHQLF